MGKPPPLFDLSSTRACRHFDTTVDAVSRCLRARHVPRCNATHTHTRTAQTRRLRPWPATATGRPGPCRRPGRRWAPPEHCSVAQRTPRARAAPVHARRPSRPCRARRLAAPPSSGPNAAHRPVWSKHATRVQLAAGTWSGASTQPSLLPLPRCSTRLPHSRPAPRAQQMPRSPGKAGPHTRRSCRSGCGGRAGHRARGGAAAHHESIASLWKA